MNDTAIDVEAAPSQAVAVREQGGAVAPTSLFRTDDPQQIVERASIVATSLKAVIQKQGLISRISGKEYPRCEAWTLLGTMLGVFPVCLWTRQVDGGWEARVEARTRDGAVIGAAEAQCLRSERNWKDRDAFALRSMAQTRATAKCLRMPLGFVMTLAGFEPTPAEEMVSDHPQKPANAPGRASNSPPPSHTTPTAKTPPAGSARPSPAQKPARTAKIPFPTPDTRAKMIAVLNADAGKPDREVVSEYFRKLENPAQLMPNEQLEELPLRFVPATTRQMTDLLGKIRAFGNGERAAAAFPPHPEPDQAPKAAPKGAGGQVPPPSTSMKTSPTPGPTPTGSSAANPVDHTGLDRVTGIIQHVSQKHGTGNNGPWMLYGIKICDGWINTFSDTLGSLATEHKGKQVTVWYKQEEEGRTAQDLQPGFPPSEPASLPEPPPPEEVVPF